MNMIQYRIDKYIKDINKVICRHITNIDHSYRGAVSQDILAQLRNLIEHIMLKFYAQGKDINNSYDNICKAIQYIQSKGGLKTLRRFHEYIQIVASHYTLDEENSERLMLKYYEYLLKTKILFENSFGYTILENLHDFPLNLDNNLQEYYKKISVLLDQEINLTVGKSEKYYIQKVKPFFVKNNIFYEVTFTAANDYASKFDRVIAFTNLEIESSYAVRLSVVQQSIEILGKTMPVLIIKGWEVDIRDCEYKNFSSIIRGVRVSTPYNERRGLSNFLTNSGLNLVELIKFSDAEFNRVKAMVTSNSKKVVFFSDLEYCRKIVNRNLPGCNILLYLLSTMNNKVIKNQRGDITNYKLSDLYLQYGVIPFDEMPFNFSPLGHNPRLSILFRAIDSSNRQHELLARLVRNNSEVKGNLFTPEKDIEVFGDIDRLISSYNSKLWIGHYENSKLVKESEHIFINGYREDTLYIISELKKQSSEGVQNYSHAVKAWLSGSNHGVDSEEKKIALQNMFSNSRVALVYGSAGTGKSTLIDHIAHFFSDRSKLFLAQTNPAVDNLKRRVKASNSIFMTITKFTKRQRVETDFDVLIIDECSTVSNRAMKEIMEKATYRLLILVGDSYQITSIRFGNWFDIAKAFVPETAVTTLKEPYRTEDPGLLLFWDRVRHMDDRILEVITRQRYSKTLDDSIFEEAEEDEIILCLNYDGLYGINNTNRFLQENNPEEPVRWGIQQYKINDPVLFNESDRFAPVIYNNMKGRIVDIKILEQGTTIERIQFDIELDMVLNGLEVWGQSFELLESSDEKRSTIRFEVNKLQSEDEDDDGSVMTVIPFQIAYAVSIHKAQGLEYKSVKVVITDEVEELITHNIFYTAITRAREKLRIYWSPEVENKILTSIKPRNIGRDVSLLKSKLNNL